MKLTVNGKTICKVEIADTFFKRFKGLMFKTKAPDHGLLIKPCNSIHTFNVRFPIDVVFIDQQNKVVAIVKGLDSGKIVTPIKDALYVVEGREGVFKSLKIGDIVSVH